ncbi:MAG: BON domain-containing protein [Legionellaceae bacterium]|nr:BON domain-containing protein [Legionellaceae bacterium]
MIHQFRIKWMCLGWISICLSSCADLGSGVWTGAMLVYDRHNIYKKLTDYQLGADANRALFHDKLLKCDGCAIDLAVFHRDVLLTGHVPNRALRKEAKARVAEISGIRKQYNQLAISSGFDNSVQDAWITAKIRSQVVADAKIEPRQFKVVTADRIVYLMGDVMPEQGARVIHVARHTEGVRRVVKLLNYYRLSAE